MSPLIVFTLTARTKLEQRLARELAVTATALDIAMNDIQKRLAQVFPKANVVLVQNLYAGFRVRPEFILLVEIANSERHDGLSVVKLRLQKPEGEEPKDDPLRKEWDAWESCRPHGLHHDIVLMDLQKCEHNGELVALLYADAEQLIGVDQTLPLETAMLDAVRLGVPTPQSVADLLFQMYERLGLLLYRHSADEKPADKDYAFDAKRLDKRLADNLIAWADKSGNAFNVRSGATTETNADVWLVQHYRDPASMMEWILKQSKPADHIPRLLRGRSHGDLHGRNVLVGRVGDRVLWPAVYDYGSMGRANLIGWDFVKMETEFKLRAYPKLFSATNFTAEVIRFEEDLFEKTERCRKTGHCPDLSPNPSPTDRLRWLLLMLRRIAGEHLSYGSRSSLWLHEYYFLLALYGLNAGRFENLTPIEQKGAFLSAGAAAARYASSFK